MRGVNDGAVGELLAWCLARGYELRFIEQMPLDAQHGWDRSVMVTAGEIRASLRERFELTPADSAGRGARPLSASSSTAARPPSASSPVSLIRSAPPATGSASRPTARCATACSPSARLTCAGRYGTGRATPSCWR